MQPHTKVSGTWKAVNVIHTKVSGTWKAVNNGYIKVSGAWKQFYARVTYSLINLSNGYQDSGGATTTYAVTIRVQTDGTIDVLRLVGSDSLNEETFCTPVGFVAGTHIRWSYVSGDSMTGGDAVDTWHAMTSERTFTMQYTSGGGSDFILGTYNIELSDDGGVTEVANKDGIVLTVGEIF